MVVMKVVLKVVMKVVMKVVVKVKGDAEGGGSDLFSVGAPGGLAGEPSV